ncbi:MAG: hypothetical protein V1647_01580 [Pseudomonadota bacterium]
MKFFAAVIIVLSMLVSCSAFAVIAELNKKDFAESIYKSNLGSFDSVGANKVEGVYAAGIATLPANCKELIMKKAVAHVLKNTFGCANCPVTNQNMSPTATLDSSDNISLVPVVREDGNLDRSRVRCRIDKSSLVKDATKILVMPDKQEPNNPSRPLNQYSRIIFMDRDEEGLVFPVKLKYRDNGRNKPGIWTLEGGDGKSFVINEANFYLRPKYVELSSAYRITPDNICVAAVSTAGSGVSTCTKYEGNIVLTTKKTLTLGVTATLNGMKTIMRFAEPKNVIFVGGNTSDADMHNYKNVWKNAQH